MKKQVRTDILNDNTTPVKLIFRIAWPTMLQEILSVAVSYVDAAMVGSLGANATAAVGATTTLTWWLCGMVSGLSIGFLSFISRKIGENKSKEAAQASSQALLTGAIAGTLFTVFALTCAGFVPVWMRVSEEIRADATTYFAILYAAMLPRSLSIAASTVLRATGDTKTPMWVNIGVNAVNVILNALLIYPDRYTQIGNTLIHLPGAGMGVAGAAWASAISIALGGVMMVYRLWCHPVVSPRGQSFKPNPQILRPCMKVAVPAMLQRCVNSLGYVVFASMVNGLGTVSTAAHSIANTAESAFYIPGYGMQDAASTLAGFLYGREDKDKMREYSRLLLLIETCFMIVSGTMLFLFARQMMGFFTADLQVIAMGAVVLRMVSVTEPAYGVSVVLEGIYRGVGDTMTPFRYGAIGMWGVRIAGTFLLFRLFGGSLTIAWGCMIAHNMLVFILMGRRYLSGKWNPLLREETGSPVR